MTVLRVRILLALSVHTATSFAECIEDYVCWKGAETTVITRGFVQQCTCHDGQCSQDCSFLKLGENEELKTHPTRKCVCKSTWSSSYCEPAVQHGCQSSGQCDEDGFCIPEDDECVGRDEALPEDWGVYCDESHNKVAPLSPARMRLLLSLLVLGQARAAFLEQLLVVREEEQG